MLLKRPKDGEYREVTKFLWLPKRFDGGWRWLETVTTRQMYLYHMGFQPGWVDVCLVNPNDEETPLYPKYETEQECKHRYISMGVDADKVIVTKSPSMALWSTSRKCLLGGKGEPEALEVVQSQSGSTFTATYDNNRHVSLPIRKELTEEMVKEINDSDGIIATCAHYGEPNFRYGFIPKN